MRELEFRAWFPQENRMINNVPIDENGKYKHCTSTGFALQYDPSYIALEVMQYTGLKDKNGVKIFEGDVVKNSWDDIFEIKFGECGNGNICWNGWYMNPPNKKINYCVPWDSMAIKHYEIIGNIHQNPELLND